MGSERAASRKGQALTPGNAPREAKLNKQPGLRPFLRQDKQAGSSPVLVGMTAL